MIWSSAAGWISCDLEKSSIMDSCTLHSPLFHCQFPMRQDRMMFLTLTIFARLEQDQGTIEHEHFKISDNRSTAFVRCQGWSDHKNKVWVFRQSNRGFCQESEMEMEKGGGGNFEMPAGICQLVHCSAIAQDANIIF